MSLSNTIKALLARWTTAHMEREDDYLKICEEIKKIVIESGEPLEGNCVYKHLSFRPWNVLSNKRKNLRKAVLGKKLVCEIGFNAGHSFLSMMLANPTAQYVLFDIGTHHYSKPSFEYLQRKFPDVRAEIIWGDSRHTIPQYRNEHPGVVFDLIHIDGGHEPEVYTVDWKNSLDMSTGGSLLIFDDTQDESITSFINGAIKRGVVREASGFLPTGGYQHRILIKN